MVPLILGNPYMYLHLCWACGIKISDFGVKAVRIGLVAAAASGLSGLATANAGLQTPGSRHLVPANIVQSCKNMAPLQ